MREQRTSWKFLKDLLTKEFYLAKHLTLLQRLQHSVKTTLKDG